MHRDQSRGSSRNKAKDTNPKAKASNNAPKEKSGREQRPDEKSRSTRDKSNPQVSDRNPKKDVKLAKEAKPTRSSSKGVEPGRPGRESSRAKSEAEKTEKRDPKPKLRPGGKDKADRDAKAKISKKEKEDKERKERSSRERTSTRPRDPPRPKDVPPSGRAKSSKVERLPSPSVQRHDDQEEPIANGSRRQWDKEHIATDLAEEPIADPPGDEEVEEDYNYEDDFENYDDDFEDDEEEEEEEEDEDQHSEDKLDSGNYHTAKPGSSYRDHRQAIEMEAVKAAMVRENSARPARRDREIVVQGSDDSGQGSPGSQHNSPLKQVEQQQRPPSGRAFINFNAAKQKQQTQVTAGKTKRRGDNLKGMISLNVVRFDLFELPPIRYEAFMKSFGTSNSRQETSQTGEDNLEQEIQTEPIEVLDKWTQKPVAVLSMKDLDDREVLLQNMRGVGGPPAKDDDGKKDFVSFSDHSHSLKLSRFLEGASQVMLTLLEEDQEKKHGADLEGIDQRSVEFADKVTLLGTDLPFLEGRPVTSLAFAPDQAAILLTAHGTKDLKDDAGATTMGNFSSKVYLAVWNVSQPSQPSKVLLANDEVSSCCFSPFRASIAFAGLQDGTVAAWDLRESLSAHQEVIKEIIEDQTWIFRSPTFTTNSNPDEHNSRIRAVQSLPQGQEDPAMESSMDTGGSFQLITMEEKGCVIIWTVLDHQHDFEQHVGLAHWGTIRLVQSQRIEVDSHLFDLALNPKDGSQLLIGMEGGLIHHGTTKVDHKRNPRSFIPEYETLANCSALAFCPFGQGYFLAGSDDGNVRLHATTNMKPLISWPGTVDGEPITSLVWSHSRPCVFVVLDTLSRVHVWDLGSGDIYPAHTVHFEDQVQAMALNPDLKDPRQKQLLALGLRNGKVEVHHLKPEFKAENSESCEKELTRFLHYVSII